MAARTNVTQLVNYQIVYGNYAMGCCFLGRAIADGDCVVRVTQSNSGNPTHTYYGKVYPV